MEMGAPGSKVYSLSKLDGYKVTTVNIFAGSRPKQYIYRREVHFLVPNYTYRSAPHYHLISATEYNFETAGESDSIQSISEGLEAYKQRNKTRMRLEDEIFEFGNTTDKE